jgi:hypothetical protein
MLYTLYIEFRIGNRVVETESSIGTVKTSINLLHLTIVVGRGRVKEFNDKDGIGSTVQVLHPTNTNKLIY